MGTLRNDLELSQQDINAIARNQILEMEFLIRSKNRGLRPGERVAIANFISQLVNDHPELTALALEKARLLEGVENELEVKTQRGNILWTTFWEVYKAAQFAPLELQIISVRENYRLIPLPNNYNPLFTHLAFNEYFCDNIVHATEEVFKSVMPYFRRADSEESLIELVRIIRGYATEQLMITCLRQDFFRKLSKGLQRT